MLILFIILFIKSLKHKNVSKYHFKFDFNIFNIKNIKTKYTYKSENNFITNQTCRTKKNKLIKKVYL